MRAWTTCCALILGGGAVCAVLGPGEIESAAPTSARSGSPASPAPLGAPVPAAPTAVVTSEGVAEASFGGFESPRAYSLLHRSAESLLDQVDEPGPSSQRIRALRVLAAQHVGVAGATLSRIALDPQAPVELRVAAVKEARIAGDLVSTGDLLEVARPGQPAPLRLASIHALGRHPDADPVAIGALLEQESSETVQLQLVVALRHIGDPAALSSLEASARGVESGPLRVALYRTGREISFRSNLPLGEELSRLGPTR